MAKPIRGTPTVNTQESIAFVTSMKAVQKRKTLTKTEKFFLDVLDSD
jgi:hypothetical protein